MTRRIKLPMWIVPLLIAGLVAVFGWWGNGQLRETIEKQLKSELTTKLNANVTALQIWMDNQTRLAESIADEPGVRSLANDVLERSRLPTGGNRNPSQELIAYLRPRLAKADFDADALLVTTNLFIARRGGWSPVSDALTNKFAELFASGKPIIITPYKPEPTSTNSFQGRRRGAPTGLTRRRSDQTLMQVAAPVRDTNNIVRGALALIIDPKKEFSEILSVAQPGESGETYAFDQSGLLISGSRFDYDLKKYGLLVATNESSALNIRLRDPGGDLTRGFTPEDAAVTWRLTYIVASAVAGKDGVELESSRDYRGVSVVGAWKWLPEYGFGVATQMDADEAYRPLRVLKVIFAMLSLLLILCATGMFLFSYANVSWRKRLGEAELKLKQLGQYQLEEKIGEGGMGVVYRARHALMRRDTAVKLLLPDRANEASIARFEREVVLTCQLTHPNTIQVYDYGHTPEGIFYYAMEFLRGLNLHDLIGRFGTPPESRVIHILAQVCDSLAEAHAMGLVHRDIKPANVFLCDRGGIPDSVKVLDFGLVREYSGETPGKTKLATEEGLEGTPLFMSPEAIKNSTRSDPRSDIYSVGALAYYLLTGHYVFSGESAIEIHEQQLTTTLVPPSRRAANPISAELEQTILLCLNRDPNLRPQSVGELRAQLLTSPRAHDWTLQMQKDWWANFHAQEKLASTKSAISTASDIPTVKIDFASRIG